MKGCQIAVGFVVKISFSLNTSHYQTCVARKTGKKGGKQLSHGSYINSVVMLAWMEERLKIISSVIVKVTSVRTVLELTSKNSSKTPSSTVNSEKNWK